MKKRYSSYLWPTRGGALPRRCATVVVGSRLSGPDTLGGPRRLLLTGVTVQEWTRRGNRLAHPASWTAEHAEPFWAHIGFMLTQKGRLTVLCPHLYQSMTLLGLWDRHRRREIHIAPGPLLTDDPPTVLSLSLPGRPGRAVFLDTRNYGWTPTPGADLADRVTRFFQVMLQALRQHGLGTLQYTAAAQALYGYRKSYMTCRPMIHVRQDVLALERAALHGGRCECFRLGRVDGPIYECDYPGYYPWIMSTSDVPVRLRYHGDEWCLACDRAVMEGVPMIARVRLRTAYPAYPAEHRGLVMWPIGDFWTCLCGPELKDAFGAARVTAAGQWATYDTAPELARWGTACLAIRAQAKESGVDGLDRWAKALSVGLHGKLSQRRRQWEVVSQDTDRSLWHLWNRKKRDGTVSRFRAVAGLVQEATEGPESWHSIPAITAFIQAEGRYRLWSALCGAGRENVVYCATDSLFLTQAGYDRLREAGMVGTGEPGLLCLKAVHQWMDVQGIGSYRVPARNVQSGPHGTEEPGPHGEPAPIYVQTVNQSAASGQAPEPVARQIPARGVAPYLHGVRECDGTVRPWRLG